MSAKSAKRLINWHTGWLGEKDSNGDLVGDWAQFFDKELNDLQEQLARHMGKKPKKS